MTESRWPQTLKSNRPRRCPVRCRVRPHAYPALHPAGRWDAGHHLRAGHRRGAPAVAGVVSRSTNAGRAAGKSVAAGAVRPVLDADRVGLVCAGGPGDRALRVGQCRAVQDLADPGRRGGPGHVSSGGCPGWSAADSTSSRVRAGGGRKPLPPDNLCARCAADGSGSARLKKSEVCWLSTVRPDAVVLLARPPRFPIPGRAVIGGYGRPGTSR